MQGTYGELGGSGLGQKAIEHILGDAFWREAVDKYVAYTKGSELIRSVLWQIHPWAAMQRCYEIYKSDTDIETRRYVLTLLKYVADFRVTDWVEEFLDDADATINLWGQVYWINFSNRTGRSLRPSFGGCLRSPSSTPAHLSAILCAKQQSEFGLRNGWLNRKF